MAYLALTGQPQQRDHLLALLWPNYDSASGRNNLRRELSNLRKLVGPGLVQSDRNSIQLVESDSLWCDTTAFLQRIKTAKSHHVADEPLCDICVRILQEACELATDDLLAGFSLADSPAFNEWLFYENEQLKRAIVDTLQQLITHYEARGFYENGIPLAQRWLGLDPLHEPAQRALIRLLYWSGQVTAAQRQAALCKELLRDELGVEPDDGTQQLLDAVASRRLRSPETAIKNTVAQTEGSDAALSPASLRHNLPAQATAFIGRETEITAILDLLDEPKQRLVSLVAPGGMGKTRLALAVAERAVASSAFPHGIFFVPLAPLNDSAHIPTALADAVQLPLDAGSPLKSPREQVLDYLGNKQMLLLLDNFEHLLEGIGFVNEILQLAAGVKVLTTSRERLGLRAEQIYAVQGLAYPNWLEPIDANAFPAMALFIQTASRLKADLVLKPSDRLVIAQIVRLVEGMPLALELAAGWVDALALEEIAQEIEAGIDFLATDLHDMPARQRSIRAVFNGTWERLTQELQNIYARLSLFQGGFDRSAAQSVAGANARTLALLVNKALLSFDHETRRYQIHELVRQYGATRLGENESIRLAMCHKHCAYFAERMAIWGEQFRGAQQVSALSAMAADIENCRLAITWAVAQGDAGRIATLIFALGVYFEWHAQYQAGIAIFDELESALERQSEPPEDTLTRILTWKAAFLQAMGRQVDAATLLNAATEKAIGPESKAEIGWRRGQIEYGRDFEQARIQLEAGIAYLSGGTDRWLEARIQLTLGNVLWGMGQKEMALKAMEACLLIGEATGDLHVQHEVTARLSAFFRQRAERALGLHYAERSLEIAILMGNRLAIAVAQGNLAATVGEYFGQLERSRALQLESLATLSDLGHHYGLYVGYHRLGMLLMAFDDLEASRDAFIQAEIAARQAGNALGVANSMYWQGQLHDPDHADDVQKQLIDAFLLAHQTGANDGLLMFVNDLAYVLRDRVSESEYRRLLITVAEEAIATRVATRLLTSMPFTLRELVLALPDLDDVDRARWTALCIELVRALCTYSPVKGRLFYVSCFTPIALWWAQLPKAAHQEMDPEAGADALLAVAQQILAALPSLGRPKGGRLDYDEIIMMFGLSEE
ncbi:MAG: AAA family ATPase [Anaerolineales bacterium]|nr:AAA family ATPase [Anaerolineales bacterium]